MRVFQNIAFFSKKGRTTISGEFAVAGGAITAGSVKFNKSVTVTRDSAGLFTFALFHDPGQTVAAKYKQLVMVNLLLTTPPGGATEGGWAWNLNANNLASAGTLQVRINQQSWAAADPVQTIGVEIVVSNEVNA